MVNLKLYPPYGTLQESTSLKFEISDIENDNFRLVVENTTNKVNVDVSSYQKVENGYMGLMNLNIPEDSSQSAISVFAYIDELQEDGSYKTIQICPAIFTIENEIEETNKELIISPSFLGQEDLCSAKTTGEPNDKVIFSVNDRIFKILIDEDGNGSIHFKGKDILGEGELESISKLPVYIHKDNYTRKEFSGIYLNILPSTLALHAAIAPSSLDPRCDSNNAAYVNPREMPEECEDDGDDPIPGDPIPTVPPTDIPTDCDKSDAIISPNVCRVHNNSVVLLNNGMVLYAYTSPDKTYKDTPEDPRFNINRVFIDIKSWILWSIFICFIWRSISI